MVFTVAIPSTASDGEFVALVALPVALLFPVVGIIHLAFVSYDTLSDEKGIHLLFVFTEECVPWENVASYKNVGVRHRLNGGAAVWVLLTCSRKINVLTDRAFLFIPGEGPVLGMSAKEYTTELNKWIPAQAR